MGPICWVWNHLNEFGVIFIYTQKSTEEYIVKKECFTGRVTPDFDHQLKGKRVAIKSREFNKTRNPLPFNPKIIDIASGSIQDVISLTSDYFIQEASN